MTPSDATGRIYAEGEGVIRVPNTPVAVPIAPEKSHYAKCAPCNAGLDSAAVSWHLRQRLYASVAKSEGCWLWTGATNGHGYGSITVGRRAVLAHRLAWELERGAIPAGMVVRHTCDTPLCVNPAHLALGSQRDNVGDMVGRGRIKRGSAHWAAKLTEQDVASIRRRIREGDKRVALATEFGISLITVHRIARGETWAHTA